MKTGRNDPCPCGSGKKYKHCCLSPASVANDELKDLLAGQEIDTIEDMQALADQFMQQRNQLPQDDFQGLSPEQVHRMLHFPFDTPEFFTFPETLSSEPDAPILHLVQEITAAIDEKGLKATAKGNLPLKLCKEARVKYRKHLPEDDYQHWININKEVDFGDLHSTRLVLELSGLLRKTKGRFFLTNKYQQIVKKSGMAGIYPLLLKTFCQKLNWGYRDGFDEISFIQHSFLFSMYLLNLHGNDWVPFFIYEDYFLQAFPMVTEEAMSRPHTSAEEEVRVCYSIRALKRFLYFMGLASIEKIPSDKPALREFRIRKLPLLDEVVRFSI